jgi:predicted TIM-barrel fold metal-dependent hydrolase
MNKPSDTPVIIGLVLLALGLGGAYVYSMNTGPGPSERGEFMPVVEDPPEAPAQPEAPSFADIDKVDVHVHIPPSMMRSAMQLLGQHGTRLAINASGGSPSRGLARSVEAGRAAGGMYSYCFVDWENAGEPDWNPRETLDACKAQGAIGLKIFKALGLGYLRGDDLLAIDDPILDDAFEYAGILGLPVLIHIGDPKAFFEPPTEDNERFEELSAHPSWSFHGPRPDGGGWPSWRELLQQFENLVARHPGTTFIGAHFGNAPEDPDFVGSMLSQYPNYYVETGARIPEIGRHESARMHDFFVEYQDRILFGTDFQAVPGGLILGSTGRTLDGLDRVPVFYEAHWRYLETLDEDFAHPSPIQGDWTIDGIGLPEEVLLKIYQTNALRVFGLEMPAPPAVPGSEI